MPPPTTYGMRSSGDAPDAGETRVSGGVGYLAIPSNETGVGFVTVDEDIGLGDHFAIGLSQSASSSALFNAEAELLYDAELDSRVAFGARAGVGLLVPYGGVYVRPYAGASVGYEVTENVTPYLGATVNPVFDGIVWWQLHPGFVYDPGPGEGVRFGAEVTLMKPGSGGGLSSTTIVTPQVFLGGTFAGRKGGGR